MVKNTSIKLVVERNMKSWFQVGVWIMILNVKFSQNYDLEFDQFFKNVKSD